MQGLQGMSDFGKAGPQTTSSESGDIGGSVSFGAVNYNPSPMPNEDKGLNVGMNTIIVIAMVVVAIWALKKK